MSASPDPSKTLHDGAAADPVFRMLWLAWLAANVTMWMNDVASAWLMTTLTDSVVMVALVQAASTLPVFVLGLPSGALADIVDRRRYFAVTQLWVAAIALVLSALALAGGLNAPLLLALTFANGIGMAMRWPVFAAIVPEVVPRHDLSAALALNGIAMNMSRIVGPVVAGALLASVGSQYVFLLNALLSIAAFMIILRWRSQPRVSALPGERFFGAMRVGLQHVMQSPRMRVVLLRIFTFFLQSRRAHGAAAADRPPPRGRRHHLHRLAGGDGAGAIFAALFLPRLRRGFSRDAFVTAGTGVHAVAALLTTLAPNIWLAMPASALAGMAWIATANSLTLSAQLALPNWVRARGMSIYQMALMGGSAVGAALWGYVASASSVTLSIAVAAAFGPLALLLTRRLSVDGGLDADHTPVRPVARAPEPVIAIAPDEGPVMVTVEYIIDPARAVDFNAVMQDTRRARLRQGHCPGAVSRHHRARPLHRILPRRELDRAPAPP